MKIRKLLIILHRDIGYFFAGLTIIYAVSGIAVNHKRNFNPSYVIERKDVSFSGDISKKGIEKIIKDFDLEGLKYKQIKPRSDQVQLFFNKKTILIDSSKKTIHYESIEKRFLLHSFNKLHFNIAKKQWTYFADIFALALIFLAISGPLLLRGKKGFIWRGLIFSSLGLIAPIVFIII